jgi:hypothetical protein
MFIQPTETKRTSRQHFLDLENFFRNTRKTNLLWQIIITTSDNKVPNSVKGRHREREVAVSRSSISRQKKLVVTLMTLPYFASTYLISSLPWVIQLVDTWWQKQEYKDIASNRVLFITNRINYFTQGFITIQKLCFSSTKTKHYDVYEMPTIDV